MMRSNDTIMSDTERLIHNERVKLTSNFLSRIGLILIVFGFLPIFLIGSSFATICWIVVSLIVGIGLMTAAYKSLGNML